MVNEQSVTLIMHLWELVVFQILSLLPLGCKE